MKFLAIDKETSVFKKIVLTIFILAIFNISHSEEITTVIGNKYFMQLFRGNCGITFNNNYTYEATYNTDGLWFVNRGKFTIKNNVIYLEPDTCQDLMSKKSTPCNDTLGRAECRLIDDLTSLYYSKFIECTSLEKNNPKFIESISLENKSAFGQNISKILFPLQGYKVKSGAEKNYHGTSVIVLADSSGITTNNVKIREKPSTSSKALKYTDKFYLDPTSRNYDSVPKDTLVKIIARTKDKYAVDKWNNYWYLVTVGMNKEVWMYGEFIKLK